MTKGVDVDRKMKRCKGGYPRCSKVKTGEMEGTSKLDQLVK